MNLIIWTWFGLKILASFLGATIFCPQYLGNLRSILGSQFFYSLYLNMVVVYLMGTYEPKLFWTWFGLNFVELLILGSQYLLAQSKNAPDSGSIIWTPILLRPNFCDGTFGLNFCRPQFFLSQLFERNVQATWVQLLGFFIFSFYATNDRNNKPVPHKATNIQSILS